MTKDQWKNAVMAVMVGACISFLSTLFQGLADLLTQNAVAVTSGAASATVYWIKSMRV